MLTASGQGYGNPGPAPATLPVPLDDLINQPVNVKTKSLRRYLAAHNITEANIGGLLSTPLTTARYFVIHDTSYLSQERFLPCRHRRTDLGRQQPAPLGASEGHTRLRERLAESATASNFEVMVGATKYEKRNPGRKVLFVYVELIQPRRRDPAGGANNDAFAPSPSFTANNSTAWRFCMYQQVCAAAGGCCRLFTQL